MGSMKLGLDVMGGDYAPASTIEGAILARTELHSEDKIVLIGNENLIREELHKRDESPDHFDIIHANDAIPMGVHPTRAFLKYPDSSIAKGFKLLQNKELDSFSSVGNTGAMVVGAIQMMACKNGVMRPATPAIVPQVTGGYSVLIDVGTNPDCKAEQLLHFAIMGAAYCKEMLKVEEPKVGLINIGEEEEKGNILYKSAYKLLKNSEDINFIGNIEGWDFFTKKADVMVCDGFTGNIILKQTEATYRLMKSVGFSNPFLEEFDFEKLGGVPILGIDSTALIGHGISTAKTIKSLILFSKEIAHARVPEKIQDALKKSKKEKSKN